LLAVEFEARAFFITRLCKVTEIRNINGWNFARLLDTKSSALFILF